MQKIVLFLLLVLPFFCTSSLQAQAVSDSAHADIKADPAVFALLEKRKAIGIKNLKGYRVKIHFGAEKGKANEVKAKFCQKYQDVPAYMDYDMPNFSITVGNFRSRLDAYRIYKLIQPDFPNAFIVEMKIEYPDLTVHKDEVPKDK